MRVETGRRMTMMPYKVYVARDGKEFDTEQGCVDYEDKLDLFDSMTKKFYGFPESMALFMTGTNCRAYMFKPKADWKEIIHTIFGNYPTIWVNGYELAEDNVYVMVCHHNNVIITDVKNLRQRFRCELEFIANSMKDFNEDDEDVLPF